MVLLLQYTLIFSSVLILVALGGCFAEHSGVINLGLEGIMVLGALGGALVMRYFGDSLSGAALVPHAERMPSAAISMAAARRFVLLLMGCSP